MSSNQKNQNKENEGDSTKENKHKPLDEQDIALIKRYGMGPYAIPIKKNEEETKELVQKVNKLSGIKESDTGLSLPSNWDLVGDKQLMSEQPLQVARCTKIINPKTDDAKYMISIKQMAKFVVGLGDKVAPTDVEEGSKKKKGKKKK